MKAKSLLFLFFVFICLALPVSASFCACCAEPGEYSISVDKPSAYDLGILSEIRFDTANLFTNAAYPENIKGINPLAENYSITGLFQNKSWKFTFKDDSGKTGTISLPLPTSRVTFMADIHDIETPGPGNGPVLYKEWRFKHRVQQGTGIFQSGVAPLTEYFLVFQGRGNNCTSADDFKNWRLEITGRKASYAFYGKLKTTR